MATEQDLPKWIKQAAQRIANAGQPLPDTTIATIIAAEFNARSATSDYRRQCPHCDHGYCTVCSAVCCDCATAASIIVPAPPVVVDEEK